MNNGVTLQQASKHAGAIDEKSWYRSIILFITNRCDVGCATCNTGATPDSTAFLSPEWVERFVDDSIPQRETWILWTGGEPFKAPDTLCTGIKTATERGFHNEILTSGHWYRNHPELLSRVKTSGVFRIRISLDPEHQRVVSMSVIHALVDDCLASGIPVGFTLRKIPGYNPSQVIDRLRQKHPALVRANGSSSRIFHIIPTIPNNLGSKSDRTPRFSDLPCQQGFKDLVIGADGRVYPCCGLFGLGSDDNVYGYNSPLENTECLNDPKYRKYPLFKSLMDDGPYRLGIQQGVIPYVLPIAGYTCQCHACRAIVKKLVEKCPDHPLFDRGRSESASNKNPGFYSASGTGSRQEADRS